MTAKNMCSNFGGFRCSPPLLKSYQVWHNGNASKSVILGVSNIQAPYNFPTLLRYSRMPQPPVKNKGNDTVPMQTHPVRPFTI